MIERPIRYVDAFCKAGSSILTLHVEADTQENTLEALRRIRENGVRAAISVKPNTLQRPCCRSCRCAISSL